MMALQQISEEYLKSVSPLAHRISEDLVTARNAYEDVWNTLSASEQNEALNEAIIDPAVVLKYSSIEIDPRWKVEAISQFSWFTRSQLNLCSYGAGLLATSGKSGSERATPNKRQQLPQVTTEVDGAEVGSPRRREGGSPKRPPPPSPPLVPSPANGGGLIGRLKSRVLGGGGTSEEKERLVADHTSSTQPTVISASLAAPKPPPSKPKTPPPPPPTAPRLVVVPPEKKGLLHEEPMMDTDGIPKTGFDFLDNW